MVRTMRRPGSAFRFVSGALLAMSCTPTAFSQGYLEEYGGRDGLWRIGSRSNGLFSDIVVLRKIGETRIGLRRARLFVDLADGQEHLECFAEDYDVIESSKGAFHGSVRFLVPTFSGVVGQLRPRANGAYCVAFVNKAEDGWYRLGSQAYGEPWEDARLHLAPEPGTDGVLFASIDLPGPATFEQGADAGASALSMGVRCLPSLDSRERFRTLSILQSASFLVGSRRGAITRLGRDVLSVVDALPSKERWMLYGLFPKSDVPGYIELATDSLIEAAKDEAFWSSLPEPLRLSWRDWIQRVRAEFLETRGILGSVARSVDAADAVHDRALARGLLRNCPDGPWTGVRQSAVVRFWDEGDEGMKDMLMDKLRFWANIQKSRIYDDRGQWVNRQEMVDFWTTWLHS